MPATAGELVRVGGTPQSRSRPTTLAAIALAVILLSIGAALSLEAAGIAPCELCLKERFPYYAGVALGAVTVAAAARAPRPLALACFALLAALFLFSTGFGIYHAGVEWGFWPGPTDCTGGMLKRAGSSADFMRQLQSVHVVRCDVVAIRILGVSLAGWNAVASLAIAALATVGFSRVTRT